MIPFSAQDPFPFLEAGTYTYAAAKEHSARVDDWLGFKADEVEGNLQPKPGQEIWHQLNIHAFQTPYVEIRTLLETVHPSSGQTMIDLGCGYGRMAHVIGRHFPDVRFIGYELVPERIAEGLRVLKPFTYDNIQLQEHDLLRMPLQKAAYYFIYDYGTKAAIQKTLEELKELSKTGSFQVIARGRASRHLIHRDHFWLSEVHPPRHFETFSIYQA